MKNICVIGSIGKLGSELMKHPDTVACPWMFENDASIINEWFNDNPQIDTVWHVARTCRKVGTRRDHETLLLEHSGMINLLKTRAKSCRFVYASSKIVYGLGGVSDNADEVLPVDKVAKYFFDSDIGTFNCPIWQDTKQVNISSLDHQRTIYATTKLINESLIRKHCSNFKIVRIWDIL
tara:strand:+ start:1285 stop:1821 length:537 start_codon:yes stop_codon:yes gene_type:complete